MWFYIFIGIFAASFYKIGNDKNSKLAKVVSFFILFLTSSLRYGIGHDYLNVYVPIFNKIAMGHNVTWDIGTIVVCKIITLFTSDPFWFFFVFSFFTNLFIFLAIEKQFKNNRYGWLAILLFVISGAFVSSFNIVRQYLSIAIFLYSIQYIISGNFKKYFFWIIIASTIHNSAIILIPVYFIRKINMNLKHQLVYSIGLLILLPFIDKIFYFILSFTKYVNYLDIDLFNTANATISELFISLFLFIFTMIFSYRKNKYEKQFKVYYFILLMYLLISIFSSKIILAYRIIVYFKIIQIVIIPYEISKMDNRNNRLLFELLFILFYISMFLYGGYVLGWYDTKYISIFNMIK